MKRFAIAFAVVTAGLVFGVSDVGAQETTDNTLYVKTFPETDVGTKIANAMAACSPATSRGIPCMLVVDSYLDAYAPGVYPALCSSCYLVDYRMGPGVEAMTALTARGWPAVGRAFSGVDIGAKVNADLAASVALGTIPTIYVPRGTYAFSTTIALTSPAKLECEPGTVLNYTGSAHAVELGSSSWATAGTRNASPPAMSPYTDPFEVTGCTFTGGSTMTQGIYAFESVYKVRVTRNFFHNFGNATAFDIWLQGNNWDAHVEDNLAWADQNGTETTVFAYNFLNQNAALYGVANSDGGNSHLYFLRNHIQNSAGHNAGAGVIINGLDDVIEGNNFSGMVPGILIMTSVGSNAYGSVIHANYCETGNHFSSAYNTYAPCIQLGPSSGSSFVTGISITKNYFNTHNQDQGLGMAAISPAMTGSGGSAGSVSNTRMGITNSTISDNTFAGLKTGDVAVIENNIVSQSGNTANDNFALVDGASNPAPLPIGNMHTVNANIANWEGDNGDLGYYNPGASRFDWLASQRYLNGVSLFGYSDPAGSTQTFRIDAYNNGQYTMGSNVILALQLTGYHGSSGSKVQYSDGNGTSQPAFFDANGNLSGTAAYGKVLANCGTMTTTADTTNTLSCGWVTRSSNCTVTQNTTKTIVPFTAVVPTAGTVTVTHTATAGATYAIACSVN
jgi:hypothetical protein